MPTISEAKQFAYIRNMPVLDIQSLDTNVYRFRMREIKQPGVIVIEHTGRRREPHHSKTVSILAYRSDLFGDEHSLISSPFQIYNHALLGVHIIC